MFVVGWLLMISPKWSETDDRVARALVATMGGTPRFHQSAPKRKVLVGFWEGLVPGCFPVAIGFKNRKPSRTIPKASISGHFG